MPTTSADSASAAPGTPAVPGGPGAPAAPFLRRIPAETWAVVLWFGTLVFSLLDRFYRLPGEATMDNQPLPSFEPGLLGWVIIVGMCCGVILGGRLLHRRPLAGYAVFLLGPAGAAGVLGTSEFPFVAFLGPALALYYVARTRGRRTGVIAASYALAVILCPVAVRIAVRGNIDTAQLLAVVLLVLVALVVGDSTHQAQVHAQALRTQADRQAITAERLRIAREMHDTVAHSIGIIALQAGAAARVVHSRPDLAGEAMRTVEEAGRETLSGLRRMLGALRESEGESEGRGERTRELTGSSGQTVPPPMQGLADLDRLAESTTAAGVRVALTWQGTRRALPPDIDLSAYRIVQEAVTNVLRHARTEACEVRVTYEEQAVALEITDHGAGSGQAKNLGGGFGLTGIRERVALLKGEFAAGPRPRGGFRVMARLPLPASEEVRSHRKDTGAAPEGETVPSPEDRISAVPTGEVR
ncbi:sensor histidine kinase [Streptomyces sp. NPDC050418]|uniref:sensor histidine kinase n=1 Tax=Streptomyces sp. NPDC050418 TaxID=3365612 RepID=UPI0037B23DBE